MADIIKLYKKDFLVTCNCSVKNTFHVYVDEHNPLIVTGYECAICGSYYNVLSHKSVNSVPK